ncbi:IPT/TIG domain-containing protein [Labilibaculum antarcticum]|uniref:IPT/TIG domain-containing protein n=1 Tax=Labilibaculum antarcticum TaxID=1717717 RepID=A0A1Y1CIC9_9BACT|nr:IPT/TIG domain-containing protein [Labilibaculum antarcticum]BAX80084.1 hypothetical protein ALGA_1710 [Labilibaculum antarcticum]
MKIKLLLLVCLVGALNFSCSDSDDTIELVAGKLSVTEAKAGDELTISGVGFSTVKEENRVKLNELVIPVAEATASQLTLILPKEAKTGNLTVAVDEKSIDFGVLKVLEEKMFLMKCIYYDGGDFIVTIDPVTGEETPFMELPKIANDVDMMYSSLCYLSKTKELLVAVRPEWPVDQYKILKINVETKELIEYDFGEIDELENLDLISDGISEVYLVKKYESSMDLGSYSTINKLNMDTKELELLATVEGYMLYGTAIYDGGKKMLFLNGESYDDDYKLMSLDFSEKTVKMISLNYPKHFCRIITAGDDQVFGVSSDNNKESLLKIDLEKGTDELFIQFEDGEEWYANACYCKTGNEIVFFLEYEGDDIGGTERMFKVNLNNKTTSEVMFKDNQNIWLGYPFAIYN